MPSRRTFLKLGLGAGLLATTAGAGLWWLRGSAAAVDGLRVLSAAQYRTLTVLARTHLPACKSIPLAGDDFDLARLFDVFLADQPGADQRDAGLALHLIEYGPLLFDGQIRTFSNLDDAERLAHWAGWGRSRYPTRREIYWTFARFLGMAFYDQEKVWPHIGYPGPSFLRLGKPVGARP